MMLTVATPIPTSLRGRVRAMVKAHPHWPAFLHEKGLISASARNADLLEFAMRHRTLAGQIRQLLAGYASSAPHESAAVLMLAVRVEKLLAEYARRKPRVRVRALRQAL